MLACFEAGIPFIGWQILADCAFTTVWFVAHFVVTSYVQRFRSEKVGVAHAQTTFSNHASSVAGPSVQEDVHLLKDASSATDMDNSLPYSP